MHLTSRTPAYRVSVALMATATAASLLAACGSGSSGSSSTAGASASGAGTASSAGGGAATATTAASLTIALGAPINSFNPWKANNGYELLDAPYDTLLHYSSDGQLKPWLATAWTFKDPTTLELKLREGVTFSDGAPFDATAVKANLDFAKTNKAAAGDQSSLQAINEVTVVDPSTVDIKLSAPNPALPYNLSQFSGTMASPKALANPAGLDATPAGTGPYVLDTSATRTGTTYVFTQKKDYWAAKENAFPFQKVTFSIIGDPTAAKNAAKSGQVNTLYINPGESVDGFKTVASASGSQSGFTGGWIDVSGKSQKALADVKVRQALNYAVDSKKIAEAIYKGTSIPVGAVPLAKGDAGYTDALDTRYPYDPAKAKQLLAEAGYPNGFEMKMLTVPPAQQYAQALSGYLQAVGIKAPVEVHSTDIVQALMSGKFGVGMLLSRLTGDPGQDIAALYTPASFFNVAKSQNPTFDSLLTQAATASDDAARTATLEKLATTAADQAWYFGTMLQQTITAFDPKVLTVTPPPRGQIHLYDYHPAA